MLCPFCLTDLQPRVNLCASCEHQLPLDYVKYHGGLLARFHQPAVVSVIGFRGHGKTVYLASLYYVLQNLVPRAWRAFSRQGMTFKTLQTLHQNVLMLKRGELPEGTLNVFPEPNIDRLYKIPQYGDRTLLIYDANGEAFELINEDYFQKHAGFVKHSRCALFLISLADMMENFKEEQFGLEEAVADEMHSLLERYNIGMKDLKAPHGFQHLIVVYTKADRLISDFSLPDEIMEYLEKSEVETLHDIRGYLQVMKRNSALLREYTLQTLNANAFYNNAKDHFKTVEFCAVSALGSEPRDGRLSERLSPRRVIDPLLWVLEKS